jgi:uncharacterized membrane protein
MPAAPHVLAFLQTSLATPAADCANQVAASGVIVSLRNRKLIYPGMKSECRMETSDKNWKWGIFYSNPENPALFVRKRSGLGWTLNFANPWSWAVIAIIGVAVVLPLMAPLVAIHAIRHSFPRPTP